MTYQVRILRRAQKTLAKIKGTAYDRVKTSLLELASEPRPPGCKKLSGRDAWRIRVGDYRIIYEIEDDALLVLVVHLGHRRDVYR